MDDDATPKNPFRATKSYLEPSEKGARFRILFTMEQTLHISTHRLWKNAILTDTVHIIILLIVNIYVGSFKYSGMIAYDSGESKYRTIAVPSIIIADIVYVIDDNLED